MFKRNTFSSCAGIVATLVLGTAFSTTLFAAGGAQIRRAGIGTASGGGITSPAQSFVNSYRAYPPSCLVGGLPLGKSSLDPNAQTVPVTLEAFDTTTGGGIAEADSVSIWRVACSGGGAATVLELDRPAAFNGSTLQYPQFPIIDIPGSNSTLIIPRIAQEPNTLFEHTPQGTFFYSSTIYVLEYYNPAYPTNPNGAATSSTINYNQAFTLNITNQNGGLPLVINVPAYVPPTTPLMPISGYMSTNWSNPNQSGEGIVLQVYDNGDQATRTLSFAWFTYDDQNLPFWLYGQASFAIGATSVTAQTAYFKGGTFAYAGNVVFPVPDTIWGNVTFTFPDCAQMNIAFNGDASAVNGPKGNSTATFARVADVDGLICQ